MPLKIVSGGQCGIDQAALRAARAAGLPTGGWAAKGWLTADGESPWLADYGLVECPRSGYPARTRMNVKGSDATLILVRLAYIPLEGGTLLTFDTAVDVGKPYMVLGIETEGAKSALIDWMSKVRPIRTLNVAGPRESKSPGIGAKAEAFLTDLFLFLKDN